MKTNADGPVWIDLANSPHVLFFLPVIDALRRRGADVVVTARDFAQTVQLCRLYGIEHTVVGEHGGASLGGKGSNLWERARQLQRAVGAVRPAVAVSHNSYAQLVAARLMRVPALTSMDYEYQPANHLAFRAASIVAVPEALPTEVIRKQGATSRKTWRYPGIKEDISLYGFTPTEGYLEGQGLDPEKTTVLVRPPADMALYHRFENELFAHVLERLREEPVRSIVLPRTEEQAHTLESAGFGSMLWGGAALDGREAVAAADCVVSAGGTMNREAAALGVPAYSLYAGRVAAVDTSLEAQGRLRVVRTREDITRMTFEKRTSPTAAAGNRSLVEGLTDRIVGLSGRQ